MTMVKAINHFITNHLLFFLFTLLYFAFSFFTYSDYGNTFDEKLEYDSGKFLITYLKNPTRVDYVTDLVNSKTNYIDINDLPVFSVYSRVYPALLNVFNPTFSLEQFHLENLIFGYFLFLFAYVLFFIHYKMPRKAIIAPLLIALTPMLLGHIPANPKDIPFASIYLLGILLIYFFQTQHINNYLEITLLGIVFGFAQSQRTVGLTLFFGYIFVELVVAKNLNWHQIANLFLKVLLIACVSLLVWVVCLPFLGVNLPANFIELLRNSAAYSGWNGEIIYFGKYLTKDQRPWHYLFVYLLLKLPLFVLVLIVAGLIMMVTKKISYRRGHPLVLLTFLFGLNVSMYLGLHPVVYNGIRHFLYLVVCLVLIAGFFLIDISEILRPPFKRIAVIALSLYLFLTVMKMLHLHPYEYIYYNELGGGLRGVFGKFDVEYWGAAYKEGAKYVHDLAARTNAKDIKIYTCDNAYGVDYYFQSKYKLIWDSDEADLILCDLHKDNLWNKYDETHPIIYTIQRENTPIFNVRASKMFIQKYME